MRYIEKEKPPIPERSKEPFETKLRDGKVLRIDRGEEINFETKRLLYPGHEREDAFERTVRFARSDGSLILDLASLLPEGFSFVPAASFEYKNLRLTSGERIRVIEIPHFEDAREIIAILHEIGHAHTIDLDQHTQRKKTAFKKGFPDATEGYKSKLLLEAETERKAWAWALWKIRELRLQHDIDLVAEFGSFQAFQEYIHGGAHGLGTYEHARIDKKELNIDAIIARVDPERLEELRGIYSKKYYRYKQGSETERTEPEEAT